MYNHLVTSISERSKNKKNSVISIIFPSASSGAIEPTRLGSQP